MKLLKYIPVALIAIMTFASCDSDLDKVTYNENDVVVGTLASIGPEYILDSNKASDVLNNFEWTATDFGYNASVTYKLEIDLAGHEFANKKTISAVVGKTESSVTHKELNSILLAFDSIYGIAPGAKATYQIRLSSSIGASAKSFYSNVYNVDITTFASYQPVVYIVGNGLVGWDNSSAGIGKDLQVFFADNSNSSNSLYIYTGYFYGSKELKFPTIAGDWNTVYAADGNVLKPNNEGGANYKIPVTTDGFYTLTIDTKALTINMAAYTGTANTYTTIGIVGDGANGWPSDDNVTDIAMTNPTPHIWVAKDVELTAAQIKFRANKAWDISWGAQSSSNQDLPYGLGKLGGDNFQIKTAGKYYLALNDLTGHYIIIPMSDLPVKVD